MRDLDKVLEQTGVNHLVDGRPWTSGARRSNAMSNLHVRSGEAEYQARDRMQQIILAFSEQQPTVGGRKIFATWSKPPEERRRGAHCSFVKKLVATLDETKLSLLDLERGGAARG